MEKIIIFGAGAQAKYILETSSLLEEYQVECIIETDGNQDRIGKRIYGVKTFAWDDKLISSLRNGGIGKAIVAHGNNSIKEQLYLKAINEGFDLINVIHPRSIIATTAVIGRNVIINASAIVQPYARVGNGVMVHAGVIIDHDCVIEDFVNLSPGATLAGGVHVKKRAYIFTGALIIPQKVIGVDSVVGAGAVVIRDVPDEVTVVGNPARVLDK